MVKLENIAPSKAEITKQLAKKIFGKPLNITVRKATVYDVCVVKNAFLDFFPPLDLTPILYIDTSFNEFKLYKEKYFDKTIELAKEYESRFGCEATIKTDYLRKFN